MTVLGVGLDLVDVGSFAEQLDVPGTRFELRAFSAGERAEVGSDGPSRARRLAARYAAKEAFVKAWSASRFGRSPTLPAWDLGEVEVVTDAHGRPSLRLSGELLDAVRAQLGERWQAHVSLTHDGPFAAAVVVLEGPDDVLGALHEAVQDAREAAANDGPDGRGDGTDIGDSGGQQ